MTPHERYQTDPMFRTLVDVLEHHIHQANYTPTELREAAILAAIHFEERRPPRPILVPKDPNVFFRPW